MTTLIETAQPARPVSPVEVRRMVPVKWWAALGAVCTVAGVVIIARWLASGPQRTPTGPTPVPTWMSWTAHGAEVVAWLVALAVIHFWVVKPWRRAGRFPLEGMFIVACLACYWSDPIGDTFSPYWLTNTELVQFGSWLGQIPGTSLPNARHYAEPIVLFPAMYIVWFICGVKLGSKVMDAVRRRRPQTGVAGLIGISIIFLGTLDAICEAACTRLGLFVWPNAFGPMISKGKYYQFPLVEGLIMGFLWTAMTALMYFRDENGRTFVERGVDGMAWSPHAKTWTRQFAMIGAMNVFIFAFFHFPAWVVTTHSGAWPNDLLQRSYLTNQVCGPYTDYACPGPGIPIARAHSLHVTPDGSLSAPSGR